METIYVVRSYTGMVAFRDRAQAEAVAAQMVPGDREERVLEVPLFGKEEPRGE